MKRELVKTEDGAHSFYIKELDENYHSIYGAIQEAEVVFIQAGLNYFSNADSLDILEIGLGTGLNAFMTLIANTNSTKKINYVGIEAYPLTIDEAKQLNYVEELKQQERSDIFKEIHECKWEEANKIDSNFVLTKLNTKIEEYQFGTSKYDVIYFDAFAPSAQPHLWATEIFDKLFKSLKQGGILVTYCAKGSVKRSLKEVGFTIEALPGPKGKREMTRGIKA